MKWSRPLGIVLALAMTGCGSVLSNAIDAAASRTGAGIGNAVGNRIGAAAGNALAARMPAMWTPDMTPIYMNYLFTMAFHSGSYELAGTDYEVGEWTRWRMVDSESEGQPVELERAFLNRTDDGREWWRVKYVSATEEGRDSITVEALLDPETGEFRRMRGKMPGEAEAKEMPVEEGMYSYQRPVQLTKESMEGAIVGTESVRVPAGSYTADHLRYGSGYGTYDWWFNEAVPGGLVKYSRTFEQAEAEGGPDPYNWTVELLSSGRGARSQMGVQF
jgi:hypothetical protein